jgi:spore germination protein GerM
MEIEMKRLACLVLFILATTACTHPPDTALVKVYFLDENMFAVGTEPYEKAVMRTIPPTRNPVRAVMEQLFLGPTAEEEEAGLALVLSGTTGYSDFRVVEGVAHITLTGECDSGGSTYTIANLIFANLAQFPKIDWVKIYDQNGETETPDGQSNSIPFCLEP